jgi:predicted GNAT family acetyltransferase
MIRRDATALPDGEIDAVALTASDVGEMLALVELTHPGPFRQRTIELGAFVGVRERGRLVAMAGERMWLGRHREVSGVCTHPDSEGRGVARALVARVVNRMLEKGQVPFLHVESGNQRAIALYERLGFVRRGEFPLLYAKRLR